MADNLISITLNGLTEINSSELAGFKLISDINEGLPHGYFEINDKDGISICGFQDLSIGSKVSIELYFNMTTEEMKQKKEPNYIKYPDFYILNIEDDCKDEMNKMAGTLRVYFGHPWFLFKDIKNHAYEPMNMGDLIKKILKCEDRGTKFEVIEENFAKIDDNGKLARYKCAESDWDFIYNKLLPYCCSEQNPVHLFCNDRGEFFCKSYKQLYKENSSVLYLPDPNAMGDQELVQLEKDVLEKYNIAPLGVVNMSEIQVKVGDPQINKELFVSFYMENVTAGTGVSGGKMLTNKIKTHSGDSFGNFLPIDFRVPNVMEGSSVKVIRNRPLDDSVFLMFSSSDIVDNIFQLTVSSPFVGCIGKVGQVASLIMPFVKQETPRFPEAAKKRNWLNGNWLITRIEHSIDNRTVDKSTFLSKAFLSRSNFVGSEKSTSLTGLDFLYESP